MKVGSKEFYDLINAFEIMMKSKNNLLMQITRLDKEDKSQWELGQVYQSGEVNNAFYAFMNGYQWAKSMARVDALPLDG